MGNGIKILTQTDIAVARSDLEELLYLLPVKSKRRSDCFDIIQSLQEFINKAEELIDEKNL